MKYTNYTGMIATAITFWTSLSSVYGMPTEVLNLPDTVECATVNDNPAVELINAPKVRKWVLWHYQCPLESRALREFTFDISITGDQYHFTPVANVDSIFGTVTKGNPADGYLDAVTSFSDSFCVPHRTRELACRYEFIGYISAHWSSTDSTIHLRKSTDIPPGFQSFKITRACQSNVGKPRDWCPPANARSFQCFFQGYSIS